MKVLGVSNLGERGKLKFREKQQIMSKEHRKKKNKFERPGEKDFRSKKGRVM